MEVFDLYRAELQEYSLQACYLPVRLATYVTASQQANAPAESCANKVLTTRTVQSPFLVLVSNEVFIRYPEHSLIRRSEYGVTQKNRKSTAGVEYIYISLGALASQASGSFFTPIRCEQAYLILLLLRAHF
jgi:hypothetical protein